MTKGNNALVDKRKEDLQHWRSTGNAYPNDFQRDALAGELFAEYEQLDKPALEEKSVQVSVAGRIMSRRIMGKAAFAHIQDMSGRIQIYLRMDSLPDGEYEQFKQWHLGDIIGVVGTVMKTNKQELSIQAVAVRLLSKSLRPLPEKFHGLADQETRYRQRYLDLLCNEDSRRIFSLRSRTVQYLRDFLHRQGFVEVETPMMHPIPGGAAARPFITHHNSLDTQLYLRIAPELYLKRLLVGGMEKVFEINRSFRNEGLSPRHNPEFTMIEFYQAYATYEQLMDITEELMSGLVQTLFGSTVLPYQGAELDLSRPFRRMTLHEAICSYHPEATRSLGGLQDIDSLRSLADHLSLPLEKEYGSGKIQLEIFEKTVEDKLLQPVFITQYPTEVSPLARCSDSNPEIAERFEFFMGGREVANGFSELNDPEEQALRFRQQQSSDDVEAMHYDADYIMALEYGMPPAAGEGIGIDRLLMLLANVASIREVILFPQLRPSETMKDSLAAEEGVS